MKKNPIPILKYIFLPSILALSIYFFYPRTYDVKRFVEIPNTQYWDLHSGSRIGYQYLEGIDSIKSYPIIYLHGGPGGVISDKIVNMLKPFTKLGYHIYAYDQIGSGSSSRLKDIEEYSLNRHKLDLEEIVDSIKAEKVILIGQSWGSVLATFYAIDNPEKVHKIIMTGPGPIYPLNRKLSALKAPDSLNIKQPYFSNQDANNQVYTFRDKCIKILAYGAGIKIIPDQQVDNFFTYLNSHLNKSTLYDTTLIESSAGGGGYYAHVMTLKSLNYIDNPREKIRKLKTPILILKGQYDNQKWGYTYEYLKLCEEAKLKIIPKAGHSIHIEQPDLYYKEIMSFLEQ